MRKFVIVFSLLALVACEDVKKENEAPFRETPETLAKKSACAKVDWKDREQMPVGAVMGLANSYYKSRCSILKGENSIARGLSLPIGAPSKDGLAHYGIKAETKEEVLKALYTLSFGFVMRESSGKYCEGRDMSTTNTAADTAEAGPFQQSYNSFSVAPKTLNTLWESYRNGSNYCDLATWSQGVNPDHKSCKPKSVGGGVGEAWQDFTRQCPAFATEHALLLVRNKRTHFGPINRKEAEYRKECRALLDEIDKVECL